MSRKMILCSVLLAFEDGNNKRVIQKNVGQKKKSVVRQVFIFLVIAHILLEMNVHFLSLRSRRQNRAWGGALAEPQEYGVSIHRAREAGDSFLLSAISSSLRLRQSLSPASRACAINPVVPGVPLTLHPRLYSDARIRGLRYSISNLCKNIGNDKLYFSVLYFPVRPFPSGDYFDPSRTRRISVRLMNLSLSSLLTWSTLANSSLARSRLPFLRWACAS